MLPDSLRLAVLAAAVGLGACAGAPPAAEAPRTDLAAAEPTWVHVAPVFAARCASCHGAEQPAAGLDLTDWDRLLDGSTHGEALIAYDPAQSLVLALSEQLPGVLPEDYAWRHAMPYDAFRAAHRLPDAERELLRRWIARGAPSADGAIPFDDPDGRVFVAVQDAGRVAILDPERLVVTRYATFEAFGGPMSNPHHTDYEPDGSAFYVTLIGAQQVAKVDARTLEVLAALDVAAINPTYKPGMLAVDPTSDRLYLSRSISDLSGGRSVIAIERSTMQGEELLVPYTRPHPISVTRDGGFILSGSLADNVVATIRTDNFDLASILRVGDQPTPLMQYDLSPDGSVAAITGQFSNRLYLLDVSDPENLSVRAMVPVGQEPWYPAFTPDGERVVVPDHRSNTVSIVNVARGEREAVIEDPRFAMPHGAVASHDGRYLFITNSNLTHATGHAHTEDDPESAFQPRFPLDRTGDGLADNLRTGHVMVIDARTYDVLKVLEVREFASGISIWQRGFPYR